MKSAQTEMVVRLPQQAHPYAWDRPAGQDLTKKRGAVWGHLLPAPASRTLREHEPFPFRCKARSLDGKGKGTCLSEGLGSRSVPRPVGRSWDRILKPAVHRVAWGPWGLPRPFQGVSRSKCLHSNAKMVHARFAQRLTSVQCFPEATWRGEGPDAEANIGIRLASTRPGIKMICKSVKQCHPFYSFCFLFLKV